MLETHHAVDPVVRDFRPEDFPEGTTFTFGSLLGNPDCDECGEPSFVQINLPESEGLGANNSICPTCFLERHNARLLERQFGNKDVTLGEALPLREIPDLDGEESEEDLD